MGGASLWEGDFSLDILCLWANPVWANSFIIMNSQLLPESARSRVPWPVRGWGWDGGGASVLGSTPGRAVQTLLPERPHVYSLLRMRTWWSRDAA